MAIKNTNISLKEMEFGVKIDSPEKVKAILRSAPKVVDKITLLITSEIYKKKGGNFFWRLNRIKNKKKVFLTLKEDLLGQNNSMAEGMKEAVEVNLTLNSTQAKVIKRIINLLGYQLAKIIKKRRIIYQLPAAQITLDFYYQEKQWYLEIESPNKKEILKLKKIIYDNNY